eukprot:712959-Prymnesium_polylepis.1
MVCAFLGTSHESHVVFAPLCASPRRPHHITQVQLLRPPLRGVKPGVLGAHAPRPAVVERLVQSLATPERGGHAPARAAASLAFQLRASHSISAIARAPARGIARVRDAVRGGRVRARRTSGLEARVQFFELCRRVDRDAGSRPLVFLGHLRAHAVGCAQRAAGRFDRAAFTLLTSIIESSCLLNKRLPGWLPESRHRESRRFERAAHSAIFWILTRRSFTCPLLKETPNEFSKCCSAETGLGFSL